MSGFAKQDKNDCLRVHPWLTKVNSVEEYLAPEYYSYLLKEYCFNGLPDTDYIKNFLEQQNAQNVLELGCGSGRVSSAVLEMLPQSNFTLTDLSGRMLSHTKERFSKKSNISYKICDAVEFLIESKEKYDLVYTLWSFSHSVHQHVHKLGFDQASKFVKSALHKFVENNLAKGGKFFIMHFDSMSEEQKILMRQWRRSYPEFSDIDQQSPSKRILDSALLELDNRNKILLSIQHMRGDQIKYSSLEEYLEVFMNFHLESFFNESPYLSEVLADLEEQSAQYKQEDGSYLIRPGCYIYKFEKI